ncbi:MAG: hypothetical protein H6722_26535 [Sandaracinus sp.]|nr:hypothetical protein [Sandaracinus sp.]
MAKPKVVAWPRDEAREAEFFEDPTPDRRTTYAAFLAEHGVTFPRELASSAEPWLLAYEHRDALFGPLAKYVAPNRDEMCPVQAEWSEGFAVELSLKAHPKAGHGSAYDSPPYSAGTKKAATLVKALPKVPVARFVRHLRLGTPEGSNDVVTDYEEAVRALVDVRESLPALRELSLVQSRTDSLRLSSLAPWWSAQDTPLEPLAQTLEVLRFTARSFALPVLTWARLRELVVRTKAHLHDDWLASLLESRWPALESLSLDALGDPYSTAPSSQRSAGVSTGPSEPLQQLLAGETSVRALRHLGLRNATFGNEALDRLVQGPLFTTLRSLDLSGGHVTIERLRTHADALRGLDSLDLTECLLDEAGLVEARTLLPNATLSKSGQAPDRHHEARYTYATHAMVFDARRPS